MKTETRFILAIGLMFLVIWGTNRLFPPILPEPGAAPTDSLAGGVTEGQAAPATEVAGAEVPKAGAEVAGQELAAGAAETDQAEAVRRERSEVVVEGPLYRFVFDSWGAELVEGQLTRYLSLREGNGAVQLVPAGRTAFDQRLVVGRDTVTLDGLDFEVEPAGGLQFVEGGDAQELSFSWARPDGGATVRLVYTFRPDDYLIDVRAEVEGFDRPLLLTSLGEGLPFSEADSAQEVRLMTWVGNHLNQGIDATEMTKVRAPEVHEGPFTWVGIKNKYFLVAVLPGTGSEPAGLERYLGGVLTTPTAIETQPRVEVASAFDNAGVTEYRLYAGPQEYARLQALGADLEEVNPYGWKWLRPVIRPFVVMTLWVLNQLHDKLGFGYGWVLVIFGVLMRIVLWPLNQKAMRAQMRNMAVQPMMKEIQEKYRDNPERLQKEMLRLYKEYGFNPLGGCLPMLLPWPVLIALFFVFQNTIELRGVPFLWLPDLSAKDPIYVLPLFMAVSMFALQWISFRSMPDQGNNPQMKILLYFMPLFFGFIFMQFPSGLNLYYAVTNIATIPQQMMIARERKAAAGKAPERIDRK